MLDDINRLRQLDGLDRIILACDVLNERQPNQMFWFEKGQYYYETDTVINVMKALEDVGMLEEISIEDLLSSYYLGGSQIAGILIEIDYWDRIDSVDNSDIIIKILKIKSDDVAYRTKTIMRLKSVVDGIGEIGQLEEYIKDYKELIEVYAYGAKKLFDMYKRHMRDVKDDFSSEFIVERIEVNIDLDVLPSFKLDVLQLKEKVESQNFLSRIDSIKRLDDFAILESEANSPLVREICQKIIDGNIEDKLFDLSEDDIRLIELYYLASKLSIKKKILFLIKQEYGFVYQEAMNLSKENMIYKSLAATDANYVYQDLDGASLDELANKNRLLLVESILASCTFCSNILDFSKTTLQCCYYNYKTAEEVCRDVAVTTHIARLARESDSKTQLIDSLYNVGGHGSIIERFFQLNPSIKEIILLGNNIILLNDIEVEACFEEKLEEYVKANHLDAIELRSLHNVFRLPLRRRSLPASIIKSIITYNPQLN